MADKTSELKKRYKVRNGFTFFREIPATKIVYEGGKIFEATAKEIKGHEHKLEIVK